MHACVRHALCGYPQPAEVKPMSLPPGMDTPQGCDVTVRGLTGIGAVEAPRAGPVHTANALWRGTHGAEQYAASSVAALSCDPVARLHLRDEGVETVGVLVGGSRLSVRLGADELSTMRARNETDGGSVGMRESRMAMQCCMDLHAVRHFTAAASVA